MLSKQVAIRIRKRERPSLVNQDEGRMAFPAGRDKYCYLFMILAISLIAL